MRGTIVAGALGALAVFGSAATANAQIDGPDFGSLGSLTDMFVDGAAGNIGGSLANNVGSIANMTGSATGSLNAGSIQGAQGAIIAGSSEGSLASVGQLAGQADPNAIPGSVSGSNDGSNDGSTMLKVVNSESVTATLNSASLGLEALEPTDPGAGGGQP